MEREEGHDTTKRDLLGMTKNSKYIVCFSRYC